MKNHSETGAPDTPSKPHLTTRETAQATGLTVFTLEQYRQLRKQGIERGPGFVKHGTAVLYPLSEVEAYLAKRGE
ncbi:MAG: hypothetical protein VX529_10350 [Pseudomonadota bacterium]|nr:hypothetical protein [Pseudomonadota bacterium]